MKKLLTAFFGILIIVSVQAQKTSGPEEVTLKNLQDNFMNPPSEARPLVWWHWMDGNITKSGIRKDIEWMHRAGLGGFQTFDAGMAVPQIVDHRLIYMTPEWKEAFAYAMQLADSLNLETAVASSPGWSSTGGPWVEAKDAMKKLTWREMVIEGGQGFNGALPAPFTTTGTFQNVKARPRGLSTGEMEQYYEDIAVIAFRMSDQDLTLEELGATVSSSSGDFSLSQLSDGDVENGPALSCSPQEDGWIQYSFPKEVTIRSLLFVGGGARSEWANMPPTYNNALEVSSDGVNFREVVKIPTSGTPQQTMDIPATKGKYFRLKVHSRSAVVIPEFRLFTITRVNHSEEKSAFATPFDLPENPTLSSDETFPSVSDVLDITAMMDSNGNLHWDVPEGRWKILRFGWSLTGHKNAPAPAEATGLEVDKLDPEAWTKYFDTYFEMYRDASKGLMGNRGLQFILTDSYEAGIQTWTPAMIQEFKERRGYDMVQYMPVLTGEIVESVERSEGFLFDWRKTIGELIYENYDRLNDIAAKHGLRGRYSEAHENGRLFCVDGMDVKRTAAVPMSACWVPDSPTSPRVYLSQADMRESASVAHIFGQRFVAAESMTTGGQGGLAYSFHPGNLKWVADLELANGINRFVIHESAHQPSDEHVPGLNLMGTGQWFNRHESWAEQAHVWIDYLARNSYMLSRGRNVADILVYYGEDTNIAAQYGSTGISIPEGYAYDYLNPTALLESITMRNGKYLTVSGTEYSVLYLGKNMTFMSVPVLRRLLYFAENGGIICGDKPQKPASNNDDPQEFSSLVSKIWGGSFSNVTSGVDLETVVRRNVSPDVVFDGKDEFRFVHRAMDGIDIYWVNKPSDRSVNTWISFRTSGNVPYAWDPVSGNIRPLSYRIEGDRTNVLIDMLPDDAQIIVFGSPATESTFDVPTASQSVLLQVNRPWKVAFQEGRGAPKYATFNTLKSYTDFEDYGIKYFSGIATYTNTFKIGKVKGKAWIDLGQVDNLAEVYVNGTYCGTCWKSPYMIDITSALKKGRNQIMLKVVNVWKNRLIGDAQADCPQKVTFTSSVFYRNGDKPVSAGLLGPVRIVSE